MHPPTPQRQFRYRAFISYSHADEEWARWLHRALETYRVPKRLVGHETPYGPVPERLTPIFRDRDELATATSLGETLTSALEQSACQLVICSRKSARSRWVNEEIKTFKRLGRADRIFALIVDGEPGASADPATAADECFPSALLYQLGPDGELTSGRTEPIAADLRPDKDSKLDVTLKLIAGMLGVGLDDLKQREAHRRQRQMMVLAVASLTGMAITSMLAGAAWIARSDAERQRVRAENEAETARQTTRFMIDLFKVSDPSEALGNTITAREILDKGAARIDRELAGQPVIQATLMDTMGTVYTSLGLYESAASLVRKGYERRLRLWGSEHAEVASSLNHLGEVLMYKADFAEAEQRLREALAVRRQLFGRSSLEAADTAARLAQLLWETGKYDEAEPFAKEALQIRRDAHGRKPHADVAASLEALGLNYFRKAEYEPAIQNLRAAAAMQKALHPGAHPALAQAIDSLAFALAESGQFGEAEPHARLALAMKRQLYGENHPATANSLNNLAFIFESSRRYDDAEATYRAALAINRKLLGESHPTIALNLSNIAYVEYAKGEGESAIDTLRASLEMNRRQLGSEHPQVGGTAASLAYWLIEDGKFDEAAQLTEEALEIRRKALGEKHPQYASALTIKAYLLLSTGRFEDARRNAELARSTLAAAMPPGSWQVAAAMNVEGAALMRQGHYAEAERLLLESQDDLRAAPIPNLAERARLRLIELYERWGKPEHVARLRAGRG